MKSYYYYQINNYNFTIASLDNYLILVTMDKISLDYEYQETKVIQKAKQEIEEYFAKKRTNFDIPVKLEGTEFQKKVWETIQKIPYGSTVYYQELAELAGRPKASRAVGNACHNNPIMIIIPCRRVTAKNGLGGFGKNINIKISLIELENI